MVPINYFAVIINVVIAMGVGFAWYGPLFGKEWARLMGWHDEATIRKMQEGAGSSYALSALGALVMSFVLAHSIIFASTYLGTPGVFGGIQGAFWSWLGFIAPATLGTVLWDKKPWKLWVLNNGYWLVVLLLMGIVLGAWK